MPETEFENAPMGDYEDAVKIFQAIECENSDEEPI